MDITRFDNASFYEAPLHYNMRSLRLQGFEASDTKFAWTGLSQFLPGGGAEMDASPLEKIYIVLSGEITIELGNGDSQTLYPLDSCFIPGGEARSVLNKSNTVATMLVVMPYPETKS